MAKKCSVDGCCRTASTRGMCSMHYQRWLRATPEDLRPSTDEDLAGQRFGRLVVVARNGQTKHGNYTWLCKCACGKEVVVSGGHLKSGHTKSCGCLSSELKSKRAIKHGLLAKGKRPRTFIIWNGMKARCYNEDAVSYRNYGARGIRMCEEWLTYENFHKWAVQNGYSDSLEIDRIDNDGDYCPENCRWVTRSQNQRNTSRTNLISINGITKCASDWISDIGVSKSTFYKHLREGTLSELLERKVADSA